MLIRPMCATDANAVSALCLASFGHSVANTLSAKGIATFSAIATPDAFLQRLNEDNQIWVAEQNATLIGVLELKEGRHIAMLFIDPHQQKQGIGRALLRVAAPHFRVDEITVKASLSSVGAYERFGFQCAGDVGEHAGLVFQPLTLQR